LRSGLFDELRILLNFEIDSSDPLLLILAGQPQLLAKLALCIHLPFRQRVAMRYRMPAMDETHTRSYLEHQLRLAGRKQRLFTDEAALQLFVQSGGIPRVIGNLALAAMFTADAQAKDLVELEDVVAASREVL
jgi:type II secretory pathway predicted ATPase ExeA